MSPLPPPYLPPTVRRGRADAWRGRFKCHDADYAAELAYLKAKVDATP